MYQEVCIVEHFKSEIRSYTFSILPASHNVSYRNSLLSCYLMRRQERKIGINTEKELQLLQSFTGYCLRC